MKIPFEIGEKFTFTKTISESDVYMFSGITGDFSPNHIDEEYMKTTRFGKRIAHGVLSLGLSSTVSTIAAANADVPSASYGYDKVRFIKPVFIGDTLTVTYTIDEKLENENKSVGKIEITNQHGEICTAAKHILVYFPKAE